MFYDWLGKEAFSTIIVYKGDVKDKLWMDGERAREPMRWFFLKLTLSFKMWLHGM